MRCPICKSEINLSARSGNQGRYYFGVVVEAIASQTGHTSMEIHEILKQKFIPKELVMLDGEEYVISRSTTDLSTVEMEEYLSRIRAWASVELSVYIPLPNEAINEPDK